jgi:hypothetical protein
MVGEAVAPISDLISDNGEGTEIQKSKNETHLANIDMALPR